MPIDIQNELKNAMILNVKTRLQIGDKVIFEHEFEANSMPLKEKLKQRR